MGQAVVSTLRPRPAQLAREGSFADRETVDAVPRSSGRAVSAASTVPAMDARGFEELYQRFSRPFFSVASGLVGPTAAQDVVHEVFEVVWSKRREAPSDPDEWAPWSWGILRNKVRQEFQRRTRKHHDHRFSADFEAEDRSQPLLADVAEIVAARDSARSTWNALPEGDRELLLLVAGTDLPGAEVAALLGISHEAYRRRVSRMRVRLTAREAASTQDESTAPMPGGGLR